GVLVHRVHRRRDPALVDGAARVGEAGNGLAVELALVEVLVEAGRHLRAPRIAAQIHVHLPALRLRPGEADEVAAVLRHGDGRPARPAEAHLADDLPGERIRQPGRAVDGRVDLVREPLPAGLPGARTDVKLLRSWLRVRGLRARRSVSAAGCDDGDRR